MKKSYLLLALTCMLALVACEQEEKLPNPQVSLTAGEATETTLSFTVTPKEAQKCAYLYLAGGAEIPAAADILSRGVAVDASKETKQTISGLTDNTEYIIVAAVESGSVQKVSSALKMKTLETEAIKPTVTLAGGAVTSNSISFTLTSTNAEAVAYVVVEGDDVPDAATILGEGKEVEANKEVSVTVEELAPTTTYKVVAAASYGEVDVISDVLEMTTAEPEAVTISEIYGRRWGIGNYGFQMVLSDGKQVMFDMYCPTSVGNIVPEAEYPVVSYPEYEDLAAAIAAGDYFTHAEGSIVFSGEFSGETGAYEYQSPLAGGNVSVTHLDAGYGLVFDIVAADGLTYEGLRYDGIVEPLFETEDFCNPPIPFDDTVIETSLTYVGGQHYADPGYAFTLWMTTEDGPYNIWTNLAFPKITDGILPAGTYNLYDGALTDLVDEEAGKYPDDLYIIGGDYSYTALGEDGTYIALAEGSTITVEHLEGKYRLILNIKNVLGTTIKATWEGEINKHWSWDPDIVQPGGGGQTSDIVVVGNAYGKTSYSIEVRDAEGKSIATLDVGCPTSVWSVLPEGEYTVDPNAGWNGSDLYDHYINGSWSSLNIDDNYENLASGTMVVKHLAEGYEIVMDFVGASGTEVNWTYSGIVAPSSDYASFNNPPIPFNEETINTSVKGMEGSHNGPGKYFDLYATTENDAYKIYLPLVAAEEVANGILPEGTYVMGQQEGAYIENYAWIQEGIEPNSPQMAFSEATVTITHLSEGYQVDIQVTTDLKTTYVASYSGLIFKTETSNNPFQNPGYTYPADFEFTFTSIEFLGLNSSGDSYDFKMTDEAGNKMVLNFNKYKVTEDGQIEPGTYASVYWYDGSDGFTFNANNTTIEMVDLPRDYPYYADGGYVEVKREGNNYTIFYDGAIWTDSRKIFRAHYEGPIGDAVGGGGEDTAFAEFVVSNQYSFVEYDNGVWIEQHGTVDGKTFDVMCYLFDWANTDIATSNILPEGTYEVSDAYSGQTVWASYSQFTYDGSGYVNPTAGSVTVKHVDGKYQLTYDLEINGAKVQAIYTGSLNSLSNPQ